MGVTRRDFIGYAAASVATRTLQPVLPLGGRADPGPGVVILSDRSRNPESLAGFQSVLISPHNAARPLVILPAITTIPRATVRLLHDRLRDGATIIFESGAGFLSARDDESQRHRGQLEEDFGIRIEGSVGLWPAQGIPYIEYSWPRAALIRDYSRAIPVAVQQGEVIARANGLPVALRRHCEHGTLIFLGAPLGPALLFGDTEARQWFSHCISM
jgi:hypothetical protein